MTSALRRHGFNVVLVVLATAGVAGYFAFDKGSVTTDEVAQRKGHVLRAFRGYEIREIRVTTGGRTARLVHGATTAAGQQPWEVEIDGARYPAEEQVVDQYLVSLREGVFAREVRPPIDRAAMGLTSPRGLVEVEMGREKYKLILGGPAPQPTGAIYAELAGDRAMVISAQLAAALDQSPEDFRSKTLVPWVPAELAALSLDGAGGARHFSRAPWPVGRGAGFRFDGSTPEGTVRASAPALDKVLLAIGELKAEAFLSDAEADRAARREVTVTLTPLQGERVILEVGGACPGHADDVVAIRKSGGARVSACVPAGVLAGLGTKAEELVDRRALAMPIDEVQDLKLEAAGKTVAMARSSGEWHLQAPVDRHVESDVGRGLLERLLAVEATGFASGAPKELGLDAPRARVRLAAQSSEATIDGGASERIEEIEVGAERGDTVFVRRLEDGAILAVPKDAAAALFPDEITLRARKILDETPAKIASVRVESAGRVQRYERADGGWKVVEPKGEFLADAGLLGHLVDALAGLTADKWIGDARPEHGLEHPRLVIDAQTADGRALRISLGAPAAGDKAGAFAQVQAGSRAIPGTAADPAVFIAPRALVDAADRWLLDRTTLLPDFVALTRCAIVGPSGKKVTLVQKDGAYQIAGAPGDASSTARAAAIHDALDGLLAEGAVSVGPPEKAQGLDKPLVLLSVESGGKPREVKLGGAGTLHGVSVVYARREGVDATFAIAEHKVKALLAALER